MKKFLGIVCGTLLVFIWGGGYSVASADVAINMTNFPDYNFRAYIISMFDLDGNRSLNGGEIGAVTSIFIGPEPVTSLKGIEYFTSLTELQCTGNYFDAQESMTTLDLSKNTKLERLICYGHRKLTKLDLSKNTALTYVECNDNGLTTLDVSGCVALVNLDCHANKLTTLDLSKNAALEKLDCNTNKLTKLDVSRCTALTELECGYNELAELDASRCVALKKLYCYGNKLTELVLGKNVALEELNCNVNELTELDISGCTALKKLYCWFNQLTELVLGKNLVLTELDCNRNQLTTLDVSECVALIKLDCHYNQLTELVLGGNAALEELVCSNNQLTALDVSKNKALTHLDCEDNQLINLDVSECVALIRLDCRYNQLTELVLGGNAALEELVCSNNQLTALDVSKNKALTYLNCENNQLINLDVSNNTKLSSMYCTKQTASPLYIAATGSTSYPYSFNLSSYMTADKFANVSDVQALDSNDASITTTYADGVAYFAARPAKLKYNYATGYGTKKMDVTISGVIDIAAPTLPGTFANGKLKAKYSKSITVSGGSEPYTWELTSGDIPTDLKLTFTETTAKLSGTPTKSGTFKFTLTVTDRNDATVSKTFTVKITKPKISGTLEDSTKFASYIGTLKVTGGTKPYTWTKSKGSLPRGLTLISSNDQAIISGSPTKAGTYTFRLRVDDKNGAAVGKDFTVNISMPAISGTLSGGFVKAGYSNTLTVSGGAEPYTWSVYTGEIPDGLGLTYSGDRAVLSGTPEAAGTFKFKLRVDDKNGAAASKSFTVKISAPKISGKLANGAVKAKYSKTLTVSGGLAPYTWRVASGDVPAGLTFTSSGDKAVLSGTPTAAGTYELVIEAADTNGATAMLSSTVKITKPELSGEFVNGAINASYAGAAKVTGGKSPYTWTQSGGTLPTGLTLTFAGNTAVLTGTPAETGAFKFELTVADKNGVSDTKSFTIEITKPDISWTFKDGTLNEAYTDIVIATGGTAPYKWSKSGTLPTGLNLTYTGSLAVLSGTPEEAGTFKFKLKVTDKNKAALTRSFTVKIAESDEVEGTASSKASTKSVTSSTYGRARTKQTTSSNGGAVRENSLGLLGEDSTNVNIYAELKVVSDDIVESYDGKDSDIVKVKAGTPLRFTVNNWGTDVFDVVVYVDDKPVNRVEVSGEGEFTLPAEIVADDFKVGVKAQSETGKRESEELYIIAE